jgi:hypothetical protein
VVAEPSRNPKQLVRDIESAVLVELGISLDHKKISVVQLDAEAKTSRGISFSVPPTISGVIYQLKGGQARVEVELEVGGNTYAGSMEGEFSSHGLGFLAAGAALRAAKSCLPHFPVIRLADVARIALARREAWVVAVETREGLQIGAAFITRDELEAAAEAALAAAWPRLGTR